MPLLIIEIILITIFCICLFVLVIIWKKINEGQNQLSRGYNQYEGYNSNFLFKILFSKSLAQGRSKLRAGETKLRNVKILRFFILFFMIIIMIFIIYYGKFYIKKFMHLSFNTILSIFITVRRVIIEYFNSIINTLRKVI